MINYTTINVDLIMIAREVHHDFGAQVMIDLAGEPTACILYMRALVQSYALIQLLVAFK